MSAQPSLLFRSIFKFFDCLHGKIPHLRSEDAGTKAPKAEFRSGSIGVSLRFKNENESGSEGGAKETPDRNAYTFGAADFLSIVNIDIHRVSFLQINSEFS